MRAWLLLALFFAWGDGSLRGQDCLYRQHPMPVLSTEAKQKLESQLEEARQAYQRDSTQTDAIIWYGRRLAYLGYYREAIEILTYGHQLHPNDARFLRHRGHRWITLRCNNEAVIDLVRAAEMVQGTKDELEPDGMPNAQNIPTSTLQTNIWYHLGLALYLEKDYTRAIEAYKNGLKKSNNQDMYMAMVYWLYISLRRAGRDAEAAEQLKTVAAGITLIENEDYYWMLQLYIGALPEEEALKKLQPDAGSLSNATTGYALGVYYLLKGNQDKARAHWQEVLRGSQWSSFGFIAAEKEAIR